MTDMTDTITSEQLAHLGLYVAEVDALTGERLTTGPGSIPLGWLDADGRLWTASAHNADERRQVKPEDLRAYLGAVLLVRESDPDRGLHSGDRVAALAAATGAAWLDHAWQHLGHATHARSPEVLARFLGLALVEIERLTEVERLALQVLDTPMGSGRAAAIRQLLAHLSTERQAATAPHAGG